MESVPGNPDKQNTYLRPQTLAAAELIIKSQAEKLASQSEQISSLNQRINVLEEKLKIDNKTGVLSEDYFRAAIIPQLEGSIITYQNATEQEKKKLPQHLLFFIDMDGLKKINTEQGMEAGDMAITNVATALRIITRIDDSLARLNSGGDEFIFTAQIRPGSDLEEAKITLEDKINEVVEIVSNGRLTVSIGCAWLEGCDNFRSAKYEAEANEQEAKRQRYENS